MHRLHKLIIWLIALIVISVASGIALATIFKERVQSIVVTELNKNLVAEISVKNIDLSFLRNFPYASLDFQNISISESKKIKSSGKILSAEQISFLFNPLSILFENYNLKKIIIRDASVNLQVNAQGHSNYKIWKSKS